MKKIIDAVKKLPADTRDSIVKALKLSKSAARRDESLVSSLLSPGGLNTLLTGIGHSELQVLNAAYREENGITYGESEKNLKINYAAVEEIAVRLQKTLMVYVLKNRQRLHNKLDKIYLYPEIRGVINPLTPKILEEHLSRCVKLLRDPRPPAKNPLGGTARQSLSMKMLETLYCMGGLATYEELYESVPGENRDQAFSELTGSALRLYHSLSHPFRTYAMLNPEYLPFLAEKIHGIRSVDRVNNHYHFILNLLFTFDSVSSFGLFLTKQSDFRKIDRKRIEDSLLKIHGPDGVPVDPARIMKLCLHVFRQLKCLSLKRDAVVISLRSLEKDLENPLRMLLKVLRTGGPPDQNEPLFTSPVPFYPTEVYCGLMEILLRTGHCAYSRLMMLYTMTELTAPANADIDLLSVRDRSLRRFKNAMLLLCVFGVIEIKERKCALTDIGMDLAAKIVKSRKPAQERNGADERKIYINPDFSVMIPKHEVPSEAIYHILSHSDVVKDDVVLHARISRQSVVRASKRGMNHDEFLATLERYSKNDIPQNLNFLLREWANQTVRIKISDATLIYTSHPEFFDELETETGKSAIIERISAHYAILDRRLLDGILKKAQKKDAVISLFEEEGES